MMIFTHFHHIDGLLLGSPWLASAPARNSQRQQQKRAEAHGAAAKDGPGHPWTVRKKGGSPMGQQKNGDLTDKAGNLIWILI